MKIEFLVALTDRTWFTIVKDVPITETCPDIEFEAIEWAYNNINEFKENIAHISVYDPDPYDKDECQCNCHCGGWNGEGTCKQPCNGCDCPEE